MLELYNIGINELELKTMIETNPEIIELSDEEIQQLIHILKQINCSNKMIKNIIISNPFYLSRIDEDIMKLIRKLTSIGVTNINFLFDMNPDLLSKDAFEIDEFINKNKDKYSLEELIDQLESNPYIIGEEE